MKSELECVSEAFNVFLKYHCRHLVRPDQELALLNNAHHTACVHHQGQKRLCGLPAIIHPIRVAAMLRDANFSSIVEAAGLLHDLLEDCPWMKVNNLLDFPEDVVNLVKAVSKIPLECFHGDRALRNKEYLDRLRDLGQRDPRVVAIKLADRLDNLDELLELDDEEFQTRYIYETEHLYLPLFSEIIETIDDSQMKQVLERWLAQMAEYIENFKRIKEYNQTFHV